MLAYDNALAVLGRQDRRTSYLDRMLRGEFTTQRGQIGTARDAYNTLGAQRLDVGLQPSFVLGCIIDAIAYCGFYKVQVDRLGVVGACDLQHASMEVFGARPLNRYVIGTMVWLMCPAQGAHAIILGAAPNFAISPQDALSDLIVQGSRVGLNVDDVHKYPFSLVNGGGIIDWSAGRPFDSIHSGEWGAMTETGLSVFLDPFFVALRVDEETGIWGFYDDQYLRVAGHNLNVRSAGHERTDHDDENEFNVVEGYTPFLWEARGGFTTAATLYRNLADADVQQTTPYYANTEPADDQQQPIHRFRQFRGYLGQGGKRTLFILPAGASGLEVMSNQTKYLGVAEENWSNDGEISLRSAKGVIIAKRAIIPQPKRVKCDEDPSGDTTANYKANGVYGSGAAHSVAELTNGGSDSNLLRAASFMDLYAHTFNWKGIHPFHYHSRDWYTPDESDYPNSGDMADGLPTFSDLQTQQYLDTPPPLTFQVDSRYGNVVYFPNDSFIALLEDGGILIGDGYGSEWRMTGGSIFESCPGDIWKLPGKSFNCWAGWDFNARANFCVDLSSNYKDVRIKAEEKLLMLGGNNGCGGVLVESKASGIAFESLAPDDEILSGIILRAKNSQVLTYANSVDVTLSGTGASDGHITLDADAGQIRTRSDTFVRILGTSAQDVFSAGGVNEYWSDNALIEGKLRVGDNVLIDGCLVAASHITSGGSVIGTDHRYLTGTGTTAIANAVADLASRNTYLDLWAADVVLDVTRLADATDALSLEFFFRNSSQYDTVGLKLFESRWQQMARLQGTSVATWTEHPVVGVDAFSGLSSYPHPGKEAWTTETAYNKQDLNLFDASQNLMADRGAAYESPAFATPTAVVPDGAFTVIKNPC